MFRRTIALTGLVIGASLALSGCGASPSSPAATPDAAPKTVGSWSKITSQQAFDARAGNLFDDPSRAPQTTAQFVQDIRTGTASRPAQLFSGINFKGGAEPTFNEVSFYAPSAEAKEDAPKDVGALFIYKIPSVVNSDASLDRAFKQGASSDLGVAVPKALMVSNDSNVLALMSHILVMGTGSKDFIQAYVTYAVPLAK